MSEDERTPPPSPSEQETESLTPLSGTPEHIGPYRILQKTDVTVEHFPAQGDPERLEARLAGAGWIVDALLGTGARGEPRPPLDTVIDQLNAAIAPKLAVDVPSGLDCDTGAVDPVTLPADLTVTFAAAKRGQFRFPGAGVIGELVIADIGIDPALSQGIAVSVATPQSTSAMLPARPRPRENSSTTTIGYCESFRIHGKPRERKSVSPQTALFRSAVQSRISPLLRSMAGSGMPQPAIRASFT